MLVLERDPGVLHEPEDGGVVYEHLEDNSIALKKGLKKAQKRARKYICQKCMYELLLLGGISVNNFKKGTKKGTKKGPEQI